MARLKLTKLELQVMEAFWKSGPSSVREAQERFPAKGRPAYTTIQTIAYRLETKKALRRVRKIGNAYIFEPVISRAEAQRGVVDDLLAFFGGRTQVVMAHMVEAGQLTLEDLKETEQLIRTLSKKDKQR